jgi:hypothetical protein
VSTHGFSCMLAFMLESLRAHSLSVTPPPLSLSFSLCEFHLYINKWFEVISDPLCLMFCPNFVDLCVQKCHFVSYLLEFRTKRGKKKKTSNSALNSWSCTISVLSSKTVKVLTWLVGMS